jgi:hypothetical protein
VSEEALAARANSSTSPACARNSGTLERSS